MAAGLNGEVGAECGYMFIAVVQEGAPYGLGGKEAEGCMPGAL